MAWNLGEDIKGILTPEIGPKSFGTFEKQAPGDRKDSRYFMGR